MRTVLLEVRVTVLHKSCSEVDTVGTLLTSSVPEDALKMTRAFEVPETGEVSS